MNVEDLVRRYLSKGRMMQVATLNNDQPWVATLYYVIDDDLNLYWISTPDRRHSREIHNHAKVAGAIPIQHELGQKVVGLQLEGHAELVKDPDEIAKAMKRYAERYERTGEWYRDFLAGKNPHKLYKIKPNLFVLFDEESFPNDTRREWRP